jgi:hypothetical protein
MPGAERSRQAGNPPARRPVACTVSSGGAAAIHPAVGHAPGPAARDAHRSSRRLERREQTAEPAAEVSAAEETPAGRADAPAQRVEARPALLARERNRGMCQVREVSVWSNAPMQPGRSILQPVPVSGAPTGRSEQGLCPSARRRPWKARRAP